ncbi:MAG: serine/threonine protein kinase [bacterium]|nr:serine/threonine protein kinase [bacterium]
MNQGRSDSQREDAGVRGSEAELELPRRAPIPSGEASTRSHPAQTPEPISGYTDENDPTIISQRPLVGSQQFYESIPLGELARVLEGKQLDHFTVERMIGGGGMGAVFRGRDLRLDRIVAIKVIPASKRDPETLRRFRLEAQAAARLDHPNIARVYYVGESDRWNYIVFEFIDGVNVRDLVSMRGPLSVDEAVFFTRQVAEALQHAHEREVVHRDIKPSNILVTANGIVKVVDMGLARTTAIEQSTADATASGVTLGTFDYISPEQARNPRDADVRSDLYSLGCSLFFMLTGQPPFSEGTVLQKLLKHGSVPPPDPRAWRDDLSDELYAILMKLMAKQPHDRYQTPAELINDLLLLAEIEDLPRSQLPGTMMFTPTVAQKTLLEANLPWLVAFAFLLGSTLWLQSMQAFSSGFALPELRSGRTAENQTNTLETPALSPADSLETTETLGNESLASPVSRSLSDDPSVDYAAAASPSRLPVVVSQLRPADVASGLWASSLDEAIELAGRAEVSEIEIRGSVPLERLVTIRYPLQLRGRSGTLPKIVVPPQLLGELVDWQSAFLVDGMPVDVEALEIEVDGTSVYPGRKVGLWGGHSSSSITLRQVIVTFTNANPAAEVFAFLVDEAHLNQQLGTLVDSEGKSTTLEIQDSCLIRGDASLIGLRVNLGGNHRFSASVLDSVVALAGVGMHLENLPAGLGAQIERNVRMYCEASTFYLDDGFARVEYGEFEQPLLSLNRNSESCVYASRRGASHLSIRGLGTESVLACLDRFLLRGSNNAYDSNSELLCRCYDRDGAEIFSFGFNEAAQNGWFEERGNERQVRWLKPIDPMIELSRASFEDFRIVEDRFLPGFRLE